MNRIIWPLALAITLIAGIVLAQAQAEDPGTKTSQGTVQTQSDAAVTTPPAATTAPAAGGTTPSTGSSDPASSTSGSADATSSGSTSMPDAVSPLPLVGIAGVTLLTAALMLSVRTRRD